MLFLIFSTEEFVIGKHNTAKEANNNEIAAVNAAQHLCDENLFNKRGYRKFVLKNHPDKGGDPTRMAMFNDKFNSINGVHDQA
jgi:hypothetical protein